MHILGIVINIQLFINIISVIFDAFMSENTQC